LFTTIIANYVWFIIMIIKKIKCILFLVQILLLTYNIIILKILYNNIYACYRCCCCGWPRNRVWPLCSTIDAMTRAKSHFVFLLLYNNNVCVCVYNIIIEKKTEHSCALGNKNILCYTRRSIEWRLQKYNDRDTWQPTCKQPGALLERPRRASEAC